MMFLHVCIRISPFLILLDQKTEDNIAGTSEREAKRWGLISPRDGFRSDPEDCVMEHTALRETCIESAYNTRKHPGNGYTSLQDGIQPCQWKTIAIITHDHSRKRGTRKNVLFLESRSCQPHRMRNGRGSCIGCTVGSAFQWLNRLMESVPPEWCFGNPDQNGILTARSRRHCLQGACGYLAQRNGSHQEEFFFFLSITVPLTDFLNPAKRDVKDDG
ncbi:hypothetical protein QBC44DRAFT_76516 [Cladorrhinum sp. PSN332]|nr:hypothetical protein QBC44DRAFT_76516 [Cladorrhinum sp. PSN332]